MKMRSFTKTEKKVCMVSAGFTWDGDCIIDDDGYVTIHLYNTDGDCVMFEMDFTKRQDALRWVGEQNSMIDLGEMLITYGFAFSMN